MQKFLWGGAALIMLGAAAAFLAVDYAMRNPASILARYGVAVMSAGLHSNPLSNINTAISGGRVAINGGNHVVPSTISVSTPETVVNPDCDNGASETIEPIQVEAVPPATAEPPTQVEESEWMGEWQPLLERGEESALDQPETPMPDADVDTSKTPDQGLLNLTFGQLLDMIREHGGGGCLSWFDYCAPEQTPVMPRAQNQGGEEESEQLDDPQWDGKEHQGCGGCGWHGCEGNKCPNCSGKCPYCPQGTREVIPVMPTPKSGTEESEGGNGNTVQTLVSGNIPPSQIRNIFQWNGAASASKFYSCGTFTYVRAASKNSDESEELNNPPCSGGCYHGCGCRSGHGYNHGRGQEDADPASWQLATPEQAEEEVGCSIGMQPPMSCRRAYSAAVGQCLPQQVPVMPLPKSTAGEEESEELNNPPCEGGCNRGCGGCGNGYRHGRGDEDVCPDWTPEGSCQCQSGCTNECQCQGNCECSPCKCGPTSTGCKSCESETAPTGQPCEMSTYWHRTPKMVTVSTDPDHQGVAAPYLVGWIRLFDSEKKPVCCEGTVRVTLYDADNETQLAEWTFDGEMLQSEKDPFGYWGYTLHVPVSTPCTACCPLACGAGCSWTTAANSQIRLEVEFTPEDGDPLRATTGAIQIRSQGAPDETKQSSQECSGCSGSCHGSCNGCGQEDVGSCCPRHACGQGNQENVSNLTPDRVDGGIAPRGCGGQLESSESTEKECGCANGCHKSCRKTDVVQLYHAKAEDVVAAIQAYIVNLCSLCSADDQKPLTLQQDLVIVPDSEGNRILINVSSEYYGELIDMIREIDGQASHYNDDNNQ